METPRCLSETELTRLVEGDVPLDRRDLWAAHLVRCPECRMVVAESSEHLENTAASRRPARTAWLVLAALVGLLILWAART
jgi:anti-sigma factor RsiW